MVASQFLAGEIPCLLTLHPGPLPLRRRLIEFVEGRGGEATVNDVFRNFRPLKNQSERISNLPSSTV